MLAVGIGRCNGMDCGCVLVCADSCALARVLTTGALIALVHVVNCGRVDIGVVAFLVVVACENVTVVVVGILGIAYSRALSKAD